MIKYKPNQLFSSSRIILVQSVDPLTNDYPLDHKFSISTPTVAGVALRSTATNKDGVSTVDIGALYKSKKTSIVVKFDALSNVCFFPKCSQTLGFGWVDFGL
ncbi:putative porin, eukaryotic type [Helianthus annuus]|nr:putative porin, eukaryotic type [Helianthus annuus]